MNFSFSNPKSYGVDIVFMAFLVVLVIFGLIMLTSASSDSAKMGLMTVPIF